MSRQRRKDLWAVIRVGAAYLRAVMWLHPRGKIGDEDLLELHRRMLALQRELEQDRTGKDPQ